MYRTATTFREEAYGQGRSGWGGLLLRGGSAERGTAQKDPRVAATQTAMESGKPSVSDIDKGKVHFSRVAKVPNTWNERLRGSLTDVVKQQVTRRPNIASAIQEFGVSILVITQVGIKFPPLAFTNPKRVLDARASFLAFLVGETGEQSGETDTDPPLCEWISKIDEDSGDIQFAYFFAELSFTSRRSGPFAVRVMVDVKEVFDNDEFIQQKQILDVPLMIMVHGRGRRESFCQSARVWASMLPDMTYEKTYFHPQLFFREFFGSAFMEPRDFFTAIQRGFFSGIEAYFSDDFFSGGLFRRKPPSAPIKTALQTAYSSLTKDCIHGPLFVTMGETVQNASQRQQLLRLTFKSCGFVSSKTEAGVEFMHQKGGRTSLGCTLHAKWHKETNTVLLHAKTSKGCEGCKSCKRAKSLDILKHVRYVARRIPAYLKWPVLVCEKLPDGSFRTKLARAGQSLECALFFIVEDGAMHLFADEAQRLPLEVAATWTWLSSFM